MVEKGITVLLVEDDLIMIKSMAAYLRMEGYNVATATNGKLALESIKAQSPDLVVTDLNMPEMDGNELLKHLAADYPQLPVIIVSGVGTMANVTEALHMGAKDFIQKPIEDMALLHHSIDRALVHAELKSEHAQYQEDLEWLVEKRTAELWGKNIELKKMMVEQKHTEAQLVQAQKLESVGQLASGIAHEINTPTQFVSSNIEFLDQSFKDICTLGSQLLELTGKMRTKEVTEAELDAVDQLVEELDWEFLIEEVPGAIEQSREGINRIATIIKAMKEFSHPGSSSISEVDLNQIIETTIIVARNEWKYVADMDTELSSDLLPTPCLGDEIGQVILNVIVNAAHAVEKKIGSMPESQKGQITIKTIQGDGEAEIHISDTGSGIPKNAQHRIFDPFFTTKKVGKGTGQGLAIAHNVVTKKHGGRLTFHTKIGVGTTFVIYLPQK